VSQNVITLSCSNSDIHKPIFGRPLVKRFALCYRSVVCLSCLSVLSVCNVGALWPNGWMDQDETWRAGRPRPRTHFVRWLDGNPPPLPKGAQPPIFGPYLLCPNGCMDQDATWYGGRPWPRRLCVRWEPRTPSAKRRRSPQSFWPMFIVAKRLDGSRWHLARR